jgi:hypothetical protein
VPRRLAASLVALSLAAAPYPASAHRASGTALSALDLIALEICYTTVLARYYEPVDPARLLGGARTGIVAYLARAGVPDPARSHRRRSSPSG